MSMQSDSCDPNEIDDETSCPPSLINTKHTNISRSIDQLTLELLTNKTQYEKYVSKNENHKKSEKQIFLDNCEKYYSQIMKITSQYLKDPDLQLSIDVSNSFQNYIQCLIRHLEIKELGNSVDFHDSDEDVLFPENCCHFEENDNLDYEAFEEFTRDVPRKQKLSTSKMDYLSRDFFRLTKNKHI